MKIIEPGMTNTNFGDADFDFDDDNVASYMDFAGKVYNGMGEVSSDAVEPVVVAKVIFEAATDGTDKLRYTSGDDAKMFIATRKALDDETFIRKMKSRLGI